METVRQSWTIASRDRGSEKRLAPRWRIALLLSAACVGGLPTAAAIARSPQQGPEAVRGSRGNRGGGPPAGKGSKRRWIAVGGGRSAAAAGETETAPKVLADSGPQLVPPVSPSRRLPEPPRAGAHRGDPNAADPHAADPNAGDARAVRLEAVDPNAVDPNAVDPNAVDPNAVDPNAVDPQRLVPETTASIERAEGGGGLLRQAYGLSLRSETVEDYRRVIAACREGIARGVSPEMEAYGRRLMSWALNRRGERLADQGREAEALADFDAAVRLDSTRWRALHNRGVSYALAGKTQEAIRDFDRVIQLNPAYANAYFNRGEMEYETGQFEEAIEDYSRAIRLAPRDAAAWNSRGHAYWQVGKFREAVRDFTMAVRNDPRNAAALTNRGDLFATLGYYAEALRDYRRAIQIAPDLGRIHQSIAWLVATCPDEDLHDVDLALTAAQRAIELDGDDDPKYLDTLAAAHADAGQFDVASRIVAQAIERVPERDSKPYRARLALYQQRKAYRASPAVDQVPAAPAADKAVPPGTEAKKKRATSATSGPTRRRRSPGSGS